ncbi:quinone oxidoreductase, YhdH/YhfP family [Denitrovibrio acetiphilus DSM 12809]|uniref:Quinone oxidoreductase, YhdH/YhfP family n=1 Tax=Denitrovibrio acetiphilus (strain DSM 12809 / NBRC 114555 / N2460) TaxID=522772 RepID=D4H5J8_DENA2|nr:YhdH/YhfP family quinone oxidoreductase [Denitrovibrio acetiphilus]ADD67618.1 quinone oxidoreductase, YhdH/YhfP family [Denitrovibrio acetiphilus DSM 12809]
MKTFKAIVTEEKGGEYISSVKERNIDDLPEGEVLINVKYSSLNFKDALSSSGNKGVTRNYPHTPGVDAAGVVEHSSDPKFVQGEEVIVTGYDLGMNTSGGFAEYIRVPSGWVVEKPAGISLKEAMIYGTAGFTSALSVDKLLKHGVTPDKGKVLVTGATGGVGSVAVAMLAKLGFSVTGVTGKADKADFLKSLGADEVISREDAQDTSKRPMLKGVYAGVVDTVGGDILATALKSTMYGGAVTTCGLTQSPELNTTVFPFILRGISLLGVDSVELPINVKASAWRRVATDLNVSEIGKLAHEITLNELPAYFEKILAGKVSGRIVVKI